MVKLLLLVSLIILSRTYYYESTNLQEDESKIIHYTYQQNPTPAYSGIIRIYHNNVMCSAVVINQSYAVTAAHCATNFLRFMTKEQVTVRDQYDRDTGITAAFVALEHSRDIALLRGDFRQFQAFPMSTVYNPKLGEHILSCGFPGDSKLVCQDVVFSGNYYFQYAVTGASLQHGQSGGPVFNTEGFIIGVNSAVLESNSVLSPTVGLEGIFGI